MNENLTIDDKYKYQILPDGEYETYCYKQELASYIGKHKKHVYYICGGFDVNYQ